MADDARKTLAHLFATIQSPNSRYNERYGDWIRKHPELETSIVRCLRPEVIRYLERNGRCSMDALRNIGGNTKFEGPGIYLHGIVGLDKRTRVYIGQSNKLSIRLWKEHYNFRYRRDHRSLHYFAVEKSSFDIFAVLAHLPSNTNAPGMDRPDLMLNILEMWSCLLFRCLPRPILQEYLPPGSDIQSEGPVDGLNIVPPLDQGMPLEKDFCADLRTSQDPLIIEYLQHRGRSPPTQSVELRKDMDMAGWYRGHQVVMAALFAGIIGFTLARSMAPARFPLPPPSSSLSSRPRGWFGLLLGR